MNPKDLPQASPILNDVAHAHLDYSKIPYQKPQPFGMIPDLVVPGLLQMVADPMGGDPREWIPLSDTVSFRPVHFNVSQGFYAHVMRVTRGGVLSRHRHTGGVHALVLKGRWHYLEHDWVAEEGSYAFEPPGETHTLVVPEDCAEMITFLSSAARSCTWTRKAGPPATTTCSRAWRSPATITKKSAWAATTRKK